VVSLCSLPDGRKQVLHGNLIFAATEKVKDG
jgi:hypothetical protein